jgi:hypothetical protein
MKAAKIRWEDSIDTNNLESVINPTHRSTAIQEKIKKRNKNREKAQGKKEDKQKKSERTHPEEQDLTTRLTHSQITHSHTPPKHHQSQPQYHKQHTTLSFVWTSSSRPNIRLYDQVIEELRSHANDEILKL